MNETERMKELVQKARTKRTKPIPGRPEIMSNLEYDTLYDELTGIRRKNRT